MNANVPFRTERWDLSDGSRIVWDVRALSTISVLGKQHLLSPATWDKTINIGWSSNPWGFDARQISSLTLTNANPGDSQQNIDVSTIAYLVFYLAAPNATVELLELTGEGKANP